MDDATEKPEGGREAQSELLWEALERCEEEILATDNFTSEEALRLGGLYITLTGDVAKLRYGEFSSSPESQLVLETLYKTSMRNASAINQAMNGNYLELKTALREDGDRLLLEVAKTSLVAIEKSDFVRRKVSGARAMGTKLLKMEKALPDQGESFVPPPPLVAK